MSDFWVIQMNFWFVNFKRPNNTVCPGHNDCGGLLILIIDNLIVYVKCTDKY